MLSEWQIVECHIAVSVDKYFNEVKHLIDLQQLEITKHVSKYSITRQHVSAYFSNTLRRMLYQCSQHRDIILLANLCRSISVANIQLSITFYTAVNSNSALAIIFGKLSCKISKLVNSHVEDAGMVYRPQNAILQSQSKNIPTKVKHLISPKYLGITKY